MAVLVILDMGVSIAMQKKPKKGWFIRENPIKMNDLGDLLSLPSGKRLHSC